jgi:ribosomal protein S18 acetylase RimI-like enzyme
VLIIETLNIEKHNLKRVSELLFSMDSDFHLKIFKDKEKAIEANKKRILLDNEGIIEYVLLKENKEIIGYILLEKGNEEIARYLQPINDVIGFLKMSFSLLKGLPLSVAIKFIYSELSYFFILSKLKYGDLYISGLAISDKEQGKGFGTLLLNETMKIAKNGNFKRVTLDVDINNKNAIKLYQKIGFKIVNKKCGVFNKNFGMYNMQYIL